MTDNPNDFWSKSSGGKEGDGGKPAKPAESGLRGKSEKQGETFWAKEMANPKAPEGEPNGWSQATAAKEREQAERDALLKDPNLHKRRRRRVIRNVVLGVVAGFVLLVGVCVIFAPQIASAIAPGYAKDAVNGSIKGKIDLASLSLSWGGPQVIEGVTLSDPDGHEIAKMNVEAQAGLWGLATGNLNIGQVKITKARAAVVREADGTTNIQRAIEPRASAGKSGAASKPAGSPAPSEPAKLPEGLSVAVVVKDLQATFTDKAAAGGKPLTVNLQDVDLSAGLTPGKPLNVDLSARAVPGGAGANEKGGTLGVKAQVENWSAPDGRLTISRLAGDATITCENIPVELIDALVPMRAGEHPPTLREALGPKLNVTIKAGGDSDHASGTIDVKLDNASVNGGFAFDKDVLTTKSPLVIVAKGSAVGALAPALREALKASPQVTIDLLPDATLTIDKVKYHFQPGGRSFPLSGAAASVTLDTTGMTGQISLPDQPKQALAIAPLHVSIETQNLADSVRVMAASNATIGQTPAGQLGVDLTASDLLDSKGNFKAGMPGSLSGQAKFTKLATAIAQPLVAGLGLDLPTDVGPTLDVALTAASGAKPGDADVDVLVTGDKLSLTGGAKLSGAALALKPQGLTLEAASAGSIASKFVKPATGWKVSPKQAGGKATVLVKSLTLPRKADGSFAMDQAALEAKVDLGGLTLTAVDPSGKPRAGSPEEIEVGSVSLSAGLKPGGDATASLDAGCSFAGSPFTAKGAFDIKGLLKPGEGGSVAMAPPMTLRPSGSLELKNLPDAMLGLFTPPPTPAKAGEPAPLDMAKLVSDTLGGPLNVTVATKAVASDAKAIDVSITALAPRFGADAGGVLDAQKVQLRKTTLSTTLAPATLETVLKAYAPDLAKASQARLAGPAQIRLEVDPLGLGIDAAGKPKLDRIGKANVMFGMPGQTVIDGLALAKADGTKQDIGRITIQDLLVRASLPVSALMGPSLPEERHVKVTLGGVVLGDKGQTVVSLDGNVEGDIDSGKPAGPLTASVKLGNLDTQTIERLTGKDGLLTGFLGGTANVETTVALSPPPAGKGFGDASMDVSLAIVAPRVKSDGPVKVSITPERIELKNPARLSVEPDVAAANKLLAAGQPAAAPTGQAPAREQLTLVQSAPITLTLNKFSFPRAVQLDPTKKPVAGPAAPMKAADISIGLDAPSLKMASGSTPISLSGTSVTIEADASKPGADGKPPQGGPPINFRLNVAEAVVGENPAAKGMSLSGQVTRAFAPSGAFDVSQALVAILGDLPMVPTALVDSLLKQKGALVDGLGPVTSVKMTVERYPVVPPAPGASTPASTAPPLIDFTMQSERATMSLRGTVTDGVFVSEKPLDVRVLELTPQMSARFIGVLPLIGVVEKSAKQAPATVVGTDLRVPLDNDLSKLNGDVRVDPGECRFETSGAFKDILGLLNQKTEGTVGRRLDPLDVKLRNGVATYDAWRVPFGSFDVTTEGTVDLVQKQVDVLTWVPFGALSDSAAAAFNNGMGGFLGKASPVIDALTKVPFRTKGPLDKPKTSPDFELAAKSVFKNLKPEDLIKKGLGDLLKDKLKPPGAK